MGTVKRRGWIEGERRKEGRRGVAGQGGGLPVTEGRTPHHITKAMTVECAQTQMS